MAPHLRLLTIHLTYMYKYLRNTIVTALFKLLLFGSHNQLFSVSTITNTIFVCNWLVFHFEELHMVYKSNVSPVLFPLALTYTHKKNSIRNFHTQKKNNWKCNEKLTVLYFCGAKMQKEMKISNKYQHKILYEFTFKRIDNFIISTYVYNWQRLFSQN